MTKKLIWRLSHLPTPLEIQGLIKDGIMTKDEGREILFKETDDSEPKVEELKSEIEFLRKLVEKLSNNQASKVVEYIHSYPNNNYHWYNPYLTWTTSNQVLLGGHGVPTNITSGTNAVFNSQLTESPSGTLYAAAGGSESVGSVNFSEIKTF